MPIIDIKAYNAKVGALFWDWTLGEISQKTLLVKLKAIKSEFWQERLAAKHETEKLERSE